MSRLRQPVTILPVVDASDAVWQDILQEHIIEVMNVLSRLALTLLEPMRFEDLSFERIDPATDLLLVPWSDGRDGRDDDHQRCDGTAMLARFLGVPLPTQRAVSYPQPPITSSIPLAELGCWSANANTLTSLLAHYPGWDRQATVAWTEEHHRLCVLRQPQLEQTAARERHYPTQMAERDRDLYNRYLAHVIHQVIQTWPQEGGNEWP